MMKTPQPQCIDFRSLSGMLTAVRFGGVNSVHTDKRKRC